VGVLTTRMLEWIWLNALERVTRYAWVDSVYSHVAFWLVSGRVPNPHRPKTFTDHLLQMKLSAELRDPLRVYVTDKEFAKLYVTRVLGEEYTIPTYAVLRSEAALDEYEFPPTCMIKPTHGSGKRFVCDDANPVDRELLKSWLAYDHYPVHREENYRHLKPKIIVEKLLRFGGESPLDYKIHCIGGQPKFIQLLSGTLTGDISCGIFSTGWEKLPLGIKAPGDLECPRPKNLDAIVAAATRLAEGFSYVRVDLYSDGEKIYVGELTNLAAAGNMRFFPDKADQLAGTLFRDPNADPAEIFASLR
jgi:hypothetical protein